MVTMHKPSSMSRVGFYACKSYDQAVVDGVIRKILVDVIQVDDLIKPGFKVHIKPNLLSLKGPDNAVTTHPALVKSVATIVKSMGATVAIGDSPAGLTRAIEKNWLATGMKRVADEAGVTLVALETTGVTLKHIRGKAYAIAKVVDDADIVINISKLKTHSLTLMTGAIKNMFGVIPGIKKSDYHRIAPDVHQFCSILVDIFETVKPQINIMDAVLAMDGNGPSSGKPKYLGYILGSRDAVALDAVAADLFGFNNDEIITTNLAHERGLGEKRLEHIEIVGLSLNDLERRPITLPSIRLQSYVPDFIMDIIGKLIWVRPAVTEDLCQRCGLCIQNCPMKAMSSRDGVPRIDYSICIKCFCCDEICPTGAIKQRMSWLVKQLS